MPYDLLYLRNIAREQAEQHGHVLGLFTKQSATLTAASCMRCFKIAVADLLGGANTVAGEATLIRCDKRDAAEFYQ